MVFHNKTGAHRTILGSIYTISAPFISLLLLPLLSCPTCFVLQMAPSALARAVRPTYTSTSSAQDILQALLGQLLCTTVANGLKAALDQGESACTEARSATAAGLAPAVAIAMRHGAQIVPCAVLGSSAGQGVLGRWFAVAAAAAQWGLGRRPEGVVIVCAKPVRVPFTAEPTQALVMEFAESARAAAAQALVDHSEGFLGTAMH